MSSIAYRDLRELLSEETPDVDRMRGAARTLADGLVNRPERSPLLPRDAADLTAWAFKRLTSTVDDAQAWIDLADLYRVPYLPLTLLWQPRMAVAIRAYRSAEERGADDVSIRIAELANLTEAADIADEARRRLERILAATPDDPVANRLYGYFLENGYGVAADVAAAGPYLRTAADQGDADAAFELSIRYSQGFGEELSRSEATAWTFRAADLGSDRAMRNLGASYATGSDGFEVDPAEALRWYERSAAAENPHAALTAGLMRSRGEGGAPRIRSADDPC